MAPRRSNPDGRLDVDGASLAWWRGGHGEPVVLVHGSWDDHCSWHDVCRRLGTSRTWVSYDRRGHSASTSPPGQGSIREDAADLHAVLGELTGPAHVVGHSYGASVALLAASQRLDLVQRLTLYEPPLFALISPELRSGPVDAMREAALAIEAGRPEDGARIFLERAAFGEGSWDAIFGGHRRQTVLANAETWLDQYRDPDRLAVDVEEVSSPTTIVHGTATLAAFAAVVDALRSRLPRARFVPLSGAGHAGPLTHPEDLAHAITDW